MQARRRKAMMCRTVGLAKGILVVAALFALGCQSSGTTGGGGVTFICGNGVCEGTESSYCAQDCPGGGACTPACNGATCGSNGCGGSCGSCSGGQVCSGGSCKSSSTGPTCSNDCSTDVCLNSTTVSKCSFGGDGCKHAQSVTCPGGQVCKSDSASCAPCVENYECEANQVCSAGACKNYSGLKYTVTFHGLKVPLEDQYGEKWDPAGLPDPYVCLMVNGVANACTTAQQDSLEMYWGSTTSATLYSTDEVSFAVYDEDLSDDDYMGGVKFGNLEKTLHGGGSTIDLFLGDFQTSTFQLSWTISAD